MVDHKRTDDVDIVDQLRSVIDPPPFVKIPSDHYRYLLKQALEEIERLRK